MSLDSASGLCVGAKTEPSVFQNGVPHLILSVAKDLLEFQILRGAQNDRSIHHFGKRSTYYRMWLIWSTSRTFKSQRSSRGNVRQRKSLWVMRQDRKDVDIPGELCGGAMKTHGPINSILSHQGYDGLVT